MFRASIGAHNGKLFKLANVVPVKNIYRVEALKFVFKSKNELHSKYQPGWFVQKIFNGYTYHFLGQLFGGQLCELIAQDMNLKK